MAEIITRLGDDGPGEEQVGYGNPPRKSRWKKGQSGNPSGKRKRKPRQPPAGDIASLMAAELLTTTEVLKGGKKHELCKFEIVAAKLVGWLVGSKSPREMIQLVALCTQFGVFEEVQNRLKGESIGTGGPWTPELEAIFLQVEREVRAEHGEVGSANDGLA